MPTAGIKPASFALARSWLLSRWETERLSKYRSTASNTVVFCSEEGGIRENGLGQLICCLNLHSVTPKKIAGVLTALRGLGLNCQYSDPGDVRVLWTGPDITWIKLEGAGALSCADKEVRQVKRVPWSVTLQVCRDLNLLSKMQCGCYTGSSGFQQWVLCILACRRGPVTLITRGTGSDLLIPIPFIYTAELPVLLINASLRKIRH